LRRGVAQQGFCPGLDEVFSVDFYDEVAPRPGHLMEEEEEEEEEGVEEEEEEEEDGAEEEEDED
jgi:hypothetical protein